MDLSVIATLSERTGNHIVPQEAAANDYFYGAR